MNRTETNAIARGLTVLGVDFGDDLLEPGLDNPNCLWEDRGVIAVNEKLHSLVGRGHTDLLPPDIDPDSGPVQELLQQAVDELRKKFGTSRLWAIKDPHLSRLLPFWQRAFAQLGVEDSYVVVSGHPMSVAESLQASEMIHPVVGMVLWADHTIRALRGARGRPCVVVEYERFVDHPSQELARMGTRLGVVGADEISSEEGALEFLTDSLAQARYRWNDEGALAAATGFVCRTYALSHELATDTRNLADQDVLDELEALERTLDDLGHLFFQLDNARGRVSQIDDLLEMLQLLRHQHRNQSDRLDQEVASLKGQIGDLRREYLQYRGLARHRVADRWTARLSRLPGLAGVARWTLRRIAGWARPIISRRSSS